MPYFCVTLEGNGIHIPSSNGDAPIVGFYAVSRLRAENASHASAVASAQGRDRLLGVLERSGGSAPNLSLSVESVERCSWLKALLWPGGGFIFFPADDA